MPEAGNYSVQSPLFPDLEEGGPAKTESLSSSSSVLNLGDRKEGDFDDTRLFPGE